MDKPKYTILDVGCGPRKRANALGIDKIASSAADVLHDLNQFPYPFPENSFETIYCDNVLEHLDDVIKVMVEFHRIAKPDAKIFITVPHYAHRNANTDPTHKHFFGLHSFDYFIEGTSHGEFHYSPVHFKLLHVEFDKNLKSAHWFDSILVRLANFNRDLYEHRFANIFPLRQISFELQVIKK
ncbi:MAG: class I SAM-dependent methyltransferase [Bacteroidetes bacterium]|nr:class I SAM-dependent methyltransferase [Bacteroidota bacterium]